MAIGLSWQRVAAYRAKQAGGHVAAQGLTGGESLGREGLLNFHRRADSFEVEALVVPFLNLADGLRGPTEGAEPTEQVVLPP